MEKLFEPSLPQGLLSEEPEECLKRALCARRLIDDANNDNRNAAGREPMRVSEARMVRYCSFCPSASRTETEAVCRLCGDDICPEHSYLIGIPTRGLPGGLPRILYPRVPGVVGPKLHLICPACAGESVHAICRVLAERGSQR